MSIQTSRRSFLTNASLGLAALTAPAWIRTAFAASGDDEEKARLKRLAAAWKRAEAAGRPLLVFVVPKDDAQGRLNGEAWGEFLNHGASEHLAMLPLAELTCASLKDVERVLGEELKAADQFLPLLEPSALLIESSSKHLRVVALAAETLAYQPIVGDWEVQMKLTEQRIGERITRNGEALRNLLWPDDETLERRLREEFGASEIDTNEISDATLAYLAPGVLPLRFGHACALLADD